MPRISKRDIYFLKKCKYQNHPDFFKIKNIETTVNIKTTGFFRTRKGAF